MGSNVKWRRHYKKDSRFVADLYTFTYHDNEYLDIEQDERVAEVVEAVAAGRNPEPKDRDKEDLVARFDRLVKGDPFVSPQRRNDREEIRRRLAMGPDAEDLRSERGRKPSLQSRLQSGMNLQICFMNDTSSDTESPVSEMEVSPGPKTLSDIRNPTTVARPQVLSLPPLRVESSNAAPIDEADFFARQARLQTEARMALAQAKEMAHMQMEVERQRLKQSPITEMVRSSLEKVGVQLGDERRRLSRVLLTELNVAQLQVVANDLHARIAALNEALVEGLLRRDDLHMEQDSMLVDVEDLTRYLGAKQESMKFNRHGLHANRESSTSSASHVANANNSTLSSTSTSTSTSSNYNSNSQQSTIDNNQRTNNHQNFNPNLIQNNLNHNHNKSSTPATSSSSSSPSSASSSSSSSSSSTSSHLRFNKQSLITNNKPKIFINRGLVLGLVRK